MIHPAINELNQLESKVNPTPVQNCQNRQNSPFPVESFPPVMRSIIEESARASQVPDSMSGMVALSCISTAVGGGIQIESNNGRTLNGNLHMLVVAKSGTGKGSVYGAVTAPLTKYNSEMLDHWNSFVMPELTSDKILIENKMKMELKAINKGGSSDNYREMNRELASIEEQMKLPPKLLVGETTEQALGMALAGQPHEAVGNFNPEARGLVQIILGKFGKGSDSTGETLYLAGYSGDAYSIERTGRADLNLKKPCLSVLFMLQPDSMKKLTTSDSMTVSGFLPRFLMADVKADFEDDTAEDLSIKHSTAESWSELLNDLLNFYRESKEKVTVTISEKASELLRKESNRVLRQGKAGAPLERYSSYVARYGENLRKLHLILHLATHGTRAHTVEADEVTALNAIEVARWFFDESMSLLKAGQADRLQKSFEKVVKLIKEKDGEITMRDLSRSHSIEEEDIKELQDTFPGTLEIVELKPAGGGRPSHVLRIIQ